MAGKTNAMRRLDAIKAPYEVHEYDGVVSGTDVAAALGEDPAVVFKTLVTVGKSGEHYVFLVPVAQELDLRKAARAVGEKNIEMIKSRELLPLTGYIHGGCSPLGMKKLLRTVVDETAREKEKIFFSGGKIGLQIETSPANLEKAIPIGYAEITV